MAGDDSCETMAPLGWEHRGQNGVLTSHISWTVPTCSESRCHLSTLGNGTQGQHLEVATPELLWGCSSLKSCAGSSSLALVMGTGLPEPSIHHPFIPCGWGAGPCRDLLPGEGVSLKVSPGQSGVTSNIEMPSPGQ